MQYKHYLGYIINPYNNWGSYYPSFAHEESEVQNDLKNYYKLYKG